MGVRRAKKPRAKTRVKTKTRTSAAEPARADSEVTLRAGSDAIAWTVPPALAMRWSHAVLNRRRWAGDEKASERQSADARNALAPEVRAWVEQLGATAFDGLIEVAIKHESEAQSWPARLFPWEYMLTSARTNQVPPITVMRSLEMPKRKRQASKLASNQLMLYVESAPAKLRQQYMFDGERVLVRHALGIRDRDVHDARELGRRVPGSGRMRMVVLADPDVAELEETVARLSPEIIHLTGFDTHQGFALLAGLNEGGALSEDDRKDGYLVRGKARPIGLPGEELARVLCGASEKPRLIAFNLFHSGARVAPMAVDAGAAVTIGFLSDFNDSLTERFFADLYSAWRHRPRQPVPAFRWALDEQRRFPGALRGTSVVCYLGQPIVDRKQSAKAASAGLLSLRASIEKSRAERLRVDDAIDGFFECEIVPRATINYSLLHNALPLFEKFDLIKHSDGTFANVSVEVMLHLGPDSEAYRRSLNLVDRVTPLSREIRVPLTSPLARSVRESIQTSLYVHITSASRSLFECTYPVSLLSANEWRDTDEDRIWLPSFVLPRDPAVARIVDSAQRYLMALADDPTMGFDGYQSVDMKAEQPYALVDAQVRALWSAIIYDHPLSYINPPPSYAESSQRIRTPSEIVDGRRGTCIDLALLLAACLEYVEIYPTIFLLEGHCFPGYWRSEESHDEFELAKDGMPESDKAAGQRELQSDTESRQRGKIQYGWYFDKTYFKEIKQWTLKGLLVPLEAVWLTTHDGFAASMDGGQENLRSKREFNSMLDIIRARRAQVTPLPIREETP